MTLALSFVEILTIEDIVYLVKKKKQILCDTIAIIVTFSDGSRLARDDIFQNNS